MAIIQINFSTSNIKILFPIKLIRIVLLLHILFYWINNNKTLVNIHLTV